MKGIVLRGVLWVFTGVLAWADSHLGPVTDLAVFNDQVYSCSQAGIFRGTGDDLTLLARPSIRVTSLSGLEDGVIYAGGQPGVAGSLGWLNPKTKQAGVIGKMGKDLVYGLAVLGDERFAVARADGEVWISQFTKREPLPSQLVHKHTAAARAVAFSPDGKWFASVGLDGVIILSEIVERTFSKSRQLLDHTAGIECLVFSPDSKFLASGSLDSKVRLHEVTGKLVRSYNGLGMENEPVAGRVPSRILSLAWSDRLVAGTSKGSLYKLSLTDDTVDRLVRTGSDPIYALAFDSKGNLLLGTHGRLQVLPR